MRPVKVVLAVALVGLVTLVPATPAQAGGWAVTFIDPVDERTTIQPATTYSITYWVLQHGNHPYEGELGTTGLKFTNASDEQVMSEGVALAEPAHYRTEVRLPSVGLWRITAVQGIFGDYEIGLLTVPGRVAVYPTPPINPAGDGHGTHWGEIRPPGFCADTHSTETTKGVAPPKDTQAAGTSAAGQGTPPPILIAGQFVAGVAAILTVVLLVRRRATRRSGVPTPL